MNKEEFLEMFTQCIKGRDIDIEFVRGEDDYGCHCVRCELSVQEDVLISTEVFGFQFPQR